MQGELHEFGPVFTHEAITHLFAVVLEKVSFGLIEINYQIVEVTPLDEASGSGVVLLPDVDEDVDVQLLDWQIECVRLTNECVHHDCDEQVQKYLGDYYLIG